MTPDGVPPRALEFRQSDASRGHTRLDVALQELKNLLKPRRNCIAEHPPSPGEPHEASPDWAIARFNLGLALAQRADGDRSQNWELTIAATRLGRAYGVHNLGGSLGWAAAPTAVLTLTALFGWRAELSILGSLGLLLTLYLVVQAAALTAEGRAHRRSEAAPSSAKVFLSQPILVCFGYFVLLAVATVALQAFLPSSLVSGFGISFALANSALTGFLVGSAVGMFVGGLIVDYFGRQELVVAIGLLITAVVSLSIGMLAVPIPALISIIAAGGFAWGCTTPSRDMLVRGAAPAGAMGAVVGFVYSGLDLGSAVTPPFLGFLLDRHLPHLIFVVTAGVLLLAIGTALIVRRNDTERRRLPQPGGFEPAALDTVA
jgi:MFS transporter, FSR family, fosmidomycin resistance protein